MGNLPKRIMKMIKELHNRGYNHLYLYPGMSPSGGNWRYEIGVITRNMWPAKAMVSGSINTEGEVEWVEDNSTTESLANGFESYYTNELQDAKSSDTTYSDWYSSLIDNFESNEILVFYADYTGRHEHLLQDAPLFDKRHL